MASNFEAAVEAEHFVGAVLEPGVVSSRPIVIVHFNLWVVEGVSTHSH